MAINVERDQKLRMWAVEAVLASHAALGTAALELRRQLPDMVDVAADAEVLVQYVLGG